MRLEIFRYAKVGTLVAGIGVAVAAGAANEGRLSVEALTALIRDADVPKDRDIFVALPSQSQLAERPFSLDLPLKHDRVPGWSYDAYEQTLIVRPGPNLYTVHHRLPPKFAEASRDRNAEGYVILDQVISQTEYVGSNAFGAIADVSSVTRRRYGVAAIGEPAIVNTFDEVQLEVSPDRAKSLTANLRLRVEGVVSPVDGQAIGCFDALTEATFTNPTEELARNCIVSARFTSVKVVDTSTDEILFQRERPADRRTSECRKWQRKLEEAKGELAQSRTRLIVEAVCPQATAAP